jgi:hypothetical protein
MDGAIVTALQTFCNEFDTQPVTLDRLRLVNIPQHVDSVYADKPLEPLLVKSVYLQRIQKKSLVSFEACSYESDDDSSFYDVSVTCYGSLREKICIPSPDEFSEDDDTLFVQVKKFTT